MVKPGAAFQPRRARRLQRGIVVVVEDIDADHGFAAVKQAIGHVHADEAGRAGDNDGWSTVFPMRSAASNLA
jgi:hypothetical protein